MLEGEDYTALHLSLPFLFADAATWMWSSGEKRITKIQVQYTYIIN